MSHYRYFLIFFLLVGLFTGTLFFIPGCGPQTRKIEPVEDYGGIEGGGGVGLVKKTELATTDWGTWKGTITFAGSPPVNEALNINKDLACCLNPKAVAAGETKKQTWVVNRDNKGVANVVVFLSPGPGKYFKIHEEDKTRTKPAAIDQPYCAYRPHVLSHYPSYYDGKNQIKTGEKFLVKNSSTVNHNIKFQDVSLAAPEQPGSPTLSSGTETYVNLYPQSKPISVTCDIHPWMEAYIWVVDHPHIAVTDENGEFEMPRVPAGKELQVVVWHESLGFLNTGGFQGKNGKKMTFQKGKNPPLILDVGP